MVVILWQVKNWYGSGPWLSSINLTSNYWLKTSFTVNMRSISIYYNIMRLSAHFLWRIIYGWYLSWKKQDNSVSVIVICAQNNPELQLQYLAEIGMWGRPWHWLVAVSACCLMPEESTWVSRSRLYNERKWHVLISYCMVYVVTM